MVGFAYRDLLTEEDLVEYLNLLLTDGVNLSELNGFLHDATNTVDIVKLDTLSDDFVFTEGTPDTVTTTSTEPLYNTPYSTIKDMISKCQTDTVRLPSPAHLVALADEDIIDDDSRELSDHNPVPQSLADEILLDGGSATDRVLVGQKPNSQ